MKKQFSSIAALLIFTISYSQNVYSYETANSEQVRKDLGVIATDNAGNTFITGYFATSLTLGGFTLNNNYNIGYDQVFVAKELPDGSFAWVKTLTPLSIPGGTSYARIGGVCSDISGNVYLTGYFLGKIKVDNKTLTSSKSGSSFTGDMFTFKLSSAGVAQWGYSDGTANDGCNAGEAGTSIATDYAGNVYVTGSKVWKVFKNTTVCNDIPGGPACSNATSKSITCPVVIKYNSAGQKQWEKQYVNNGAQASTSCWYNNSSGSDIRTDGQDIIVTGSFYGTVNFGTGPLSTGSETIKNTFLLKLNNSGNTLWARSVTGNSNNTYGVGVGLSLDENAIYISGIGENISFGTCSLPAGGGAPSFLAKYSLSGNCEWAVRPGGIIYGVVKHPNGNPSALVRRGASQPMRFDIKEFSPSDGSPVDSTCFLVADTASGSVTGYPSIAQTADGFVFSQMVTGTFHFGDLTITASIPKGGGWPDMMLIKYASTPPTIARKGNIISEPTFNKIILFPNPAHNLITVRHNDNRKLGLIRIYDGAGKMVYQGFSGNAQIQVNTQNLVSGIYYLRSDQLTPAIKFIKQ